MSEHMSKAEISLRRSHGLLGADADNIKLENEDESAKNERIEAANSESESSAESIGKNFVDNLKSELTAIVEVASEATKLDGKRLEEECAAIDPENQAKLDEMKKRLDGMADSKALTLKHLIKAYEIAYTTPKYIAGHSWYGCTCTGVRPSISEFIGEKTDYERNMSSAKSRAKSGLSRAYDNAKAYFEDIGDLSYIEKAEKNFRDQMELRDHQLLHELVLIGKSTDISDGISRIHPLMQTDEMAVELDDAFKKAARKVMVDFPGFSALFESIEYEKHDFNSGMSFFEKLIERDNLSGGIEINADKAWDKLNDAFIDGLESFKDKASYEIECLLRRKCGIPIELILEEIEEKLISVA